MLKRSANLQLISLTGLALFLAGPAAAGVGDLDRPAPDSRLGTGVHLASTPTLDFEEVLAQAQTSIDNLSLDGINEAWATVSEDTAYGLDLTPSIDIISGPVSLGLTIPMTVALYDPYAGGFGVDSSLQVQRYESVSDVLGTLRYLWITPENAPYSVKLDQFSAVTVGSGMLIDGYNPHIGASDAFLSGQFQATSDFVTADFYVDDVAKPLLGLGAFEARPLSFLAFPAFRTARTGWAIVVGEDDAVAGSIGTSLVSNSRVELGIDFGYDSWLDEGGSAESGVISAGLNFGPRWGSGIDVHVGQANLHDRFEIGRMSAFDALWSEEGATALEEDQALLSGFGLHFGRGPELSVEHTLTSVEQEIQASVALPYSRVLRVIGSAAARGARGDLASGEVVGAGTVRFGTATGLSIDTGIVFSAEEIVTNIELRIGWEGRENRHADRMDRKQAQKAKTSET